MKVLWTIALLSFLLHANAEAESKKYDSLVHAMKPIKKAIGSAVPQPEELVKKATPLPELISGEAKSVVLGPETKGPIIIGGTPINPADIITALLNGGAGPLGAIGGLLTGLFAIGAALGAGLAALVAVIVPPLQIANQILAIIALALLVAYVVEDKKSYDYYDSGYGEYDLGYSSSGSYDVGGGYSEPSSSYGAPAASSSGSGTSSYSSYRRSDSEGNVRRARSNVYRPIVNRVSGMVSEAVKKYSQLYSD